MNNEQLEKYILDIHGKVSEMAARFPGLEKRVGSLEDREREAAERLNKILGIAIAFPVLVSIVTIVVAVYTK